MWKAVEAAGGGGGGGGVGGPVGRLIAGERLVAEVGRLIREVAGVMRETVDGAVREPIAERS